MTSLRLRWLGQALGFEKIVLKAGKMLCHFPKRPTKHLHRKFFSSFCKSSKPSPNASE